MTVPRRLPPTQASRLANLSRFQRGALGGESKLARPVVVPKSPSGRFLPVTAGFLPVRSQSWGNPSVTITTSYTFVFNDSNWVGKAYGGRSWWAYGAAGDSRLYLADNGMYQVSGRWNSATASVLSVTGAWNASTEAGPDQIITSGAGPHPTTGYYGAFCQVYVAGPGSHFGFRVDVEGGGLTGIEVAVIKLG